MSKRILFVFWAVGCAMWIMGSVAEAADKPNVLFIAVDDLNDWIGCLGGHPQALTPNMDRLAAGGVLFANAHCAAPACNPSRAAIFSGHLPDTTGVWSNLSKSIGKLQPDAVLLPTAFSRAGYATRGTGKLLHRNENDSFDTYFSTEQRWSPFTGSVVTYTPEELPSKGSSDPRHVVDFKGKTYVLPFNRMPSDRNPTREGGESFDWGPIDLPDSDFGDTRITDWAIESLSEKAQPFFLGVGYYRPHIPLFAPARFFERFESDPGQLPPVREDDLEDLSEAGRAWALDPIMAGLHSTVVTYGQWRKAVEAYLACISYVDHEIGRLIDALDHSEFGENTIIVLWGDHGWHLGEKDHWGKWTGWERSTRVPLIIVPPRNQADQFAAGGSICEQPVGLIDLYPTLMELCHIEPPESLRGESLVHLLQNPGLETGRYVFTYFDPGNVSVRSRQWRYIRYADGSEELYHLGKDPHEWDNLAGKGEYQAQLNRHRRAMNP